MKRIIPTLLSLFFISFSLQAQITVTQADAPVAGESWEDFVDEQFGVHTIGPAGANQSWDYSTNFVIQDTTYTNFVMPSSLWPPLNTYFPASNLAFDDPQDSSVTYIKVNATGIYADGTYLYAPSSDVDSIDFNPDLLFIPFPFTFNDTRSHISKFELVTYDSTLNATLKAKFYSLTDFTCDGYGSLTTPASTFPNVIRIKSVTQSTDSIFMDTTGTGNFFFINSSGLDTSISYQHLQNGSPAIVFTLDVLADDITVEEAYYTNVITTGIEETSTKKSSKVYPNPVMDDVFRIEINNSEAFEVKIYNINGQEVYRTSVQKINNLQLLLQLNSGTYIYHVLAKDGSKLDSGSFIKGN